MEACVHEFMTRLDTPESIAAMVDRGKEKAHDELPLNTWQRNIALPQL